MAKQGYYKGRRTNRGRPSKYRPELCQEVRRLGAEGCSIVQIARTIGVARSTLEAWADPKNPQYIAPFSEALKQARDLAQAHFEDLSKNLIQAKHVNQSLLIFLLKNRFRKDYSEGLEKEEPKDRQVNITIQTDQISDANPITPLDHA